MKTYEVLVWLNGNTQPIRYDARAIYQQGALLCCAYIDKEGCTRVRKWPISSIWAIDEEYKYLEWNPTATVEKPTH